MLHALLPKAYHRFLSLPLLGPIADGFDDWLVANGYTRVSRKHAVRMLQRVDGALRRRQVKEVVDLTHPVLHDSWTTLLTTHPGNAGTVHTLEQYMVSKGLIADGRQVRRTSPVSILLEEYADYLHEVRGLAASTISENRYIAQCFLGYLDEQGVTLKEVQATHIECHMTKAGQTLEPVSLQRHITALRSFLRFLAIDSRVSKGLGDQIDTPRLYRFEKLPRALPWETVRALLRSIDRSSAIGLRNYAMFLLIATYGLRRSDVAAVTLDDLCWGQGRLRIHQQKTSSPLELPLTNEVSSAIVKHLKRTPPPPPHRRIFPKNACTDRQLDPASCLWRIVISPATDLPDGSRESKLGCASHPWRTAHPKPSRCFVTISVTGRPGGSLNRVAADRC